MSLEGQRAPDFELPRTSGDTISLSETLDSDPTVVLVNRGHWCSFCAEQLSTFSRVAEDLTDRTYDNYVRDVIRGEFGDPFDEPF